MENILIIYSTSDGQTLKICQRLQAILLEKTQKVTLLSIDDNSATELEAYDKVVIGASIKYGKHSIKVQRFINENLHHLKAKPSAFFSVNLVARKVEKSEALTNPYLKKFLHKTAWRPEALAVFAGKLNYPKYKILDRLVIQFIMWMTKGPTDPTVTVEYTNWQKVEEFGQLIERL